VNTRFAIAALHARRTRRARHALLMGLALGACAGLTARAEARVRDVSRLGLLTTAPRAETAAADSATSEPDSASSTLEFTPSNPESLVWLARAGDEGIQFFEEDDWLRAPFGDNLLTDPDEWRSRDFDIHRTQFLIDYNRVDNLRVGIGMQAQEPTTMNPRVGGRLEYSFRRERSMYGFQIEQPVLPPGRLAVGASMVRRTDHNALQQVEDIENSLALLLARQDYRDYFEREGYGAYVSWRVPDFSTVSLHYRNDEYRTLALDKGTRSWFFRDTPLRPNPAIDDGNVHTVLLRLERLAHRTKRTRAGLYHWIEFERAGGGLGGDFDYTRALADVRSTVRLSPSNSLALRGVIGTTFDGALPLQKQFPLGGVDGLRAHAFAQYQGDQLALAQIEYIIGPMGWRWDVLEFGVHLLTFVDVGRAWSNPGHAWDVQNQHIQADGGVGLSTSDDNLRVTWAKNLRDTDSDFVFQLRLQRPF